MANRHGTTRSPHYSMGSGADQPVARIVVLLLLLVPLGTAYYIVNSVMHAPPSPVGQQLASFDPHTLFSNQGTDFLPTPVAVIPANAKAAPAAPSSGEAAPDTSSPTEQVKVANTGGIGAVLRASPATGAPVGSLRDGQVLTVLGHQSVNGDDWVNVQTQSGQKGWVYGRLVGPAQ